MRYFCVSDIHSFYNELIRALRQAGFNKRNKNHTLIVCGDIFDRGPDAVAVYKFLKSIPKKRCILIKGNHEPLYLELLTKPFPKGYDFSNHTVDTFCQLARDVWKDDISKSNYLKWCSESHFKELANIQNSMYRYDEDAVNYATIQRHWSYVIEAVKNHPITTWLKSTQWINYYELDKYIFVHSFIPVNILDGLHMSYNPKGNRRLEYKPDWRNSTDKDWENAAWGCPWKEYNSGLFKIEEDLGKVLVCGHWHTSDFFGHLLGNYDYIMDCAPVYYSNGLIGLDGGTMYNSFFEKYVHPQNVLVLDDIDFSTCYDKWGEKLISVNCRYEIITEQVKN